MKGNSFVERIDEFKDEICKKCSHKIGKHTLGGYCTICKKDCGDILHLSTFGEKMSEETKKKVVKRLVGSEKCKSCGKDNNSLEEDLLCSECRETFGHSLYSEL